MAPPLHVKSKQVREESCKLQILVVGAGLAGLGTAISCSLAGHDVHILEAAQEIREVGAGIQILPNSSRVLQHWGLDEQLKAHMTRPRVCNFIGWKGNLISSLDFHASEKQYPGTWYRDFHRADLQRCLVERALELGTRMTCDARIVDVAVSPDGTEATAIAADGRQWTGDLVVGADGVFGKLTEVLLGRSDPPIKTGDLAYRLLLSTEEMRKDPELEPFVSDPQVNYWLGPDAHAVNYVLRGGDLFNMVLLVPDDIPKESLATTVEGNVQEMCALFEGWDPRDISKKSAEFLQLKRHALNVFQKCRKQRTQMVVERGNIQQYLYHLHDGPEQEERDRKMQMVPTPEGEALAWRDPGLAPKLLGYDHIADVSLIVTVVVGLELTCLGQYELGQHRRRRGKAYYFIV
ncbi:hypothetical protein ATERTT37_000512 [Aspergillus terreus]